MCASSFKFNANQEQIYTVSQLNRETKRVLADHFLTVRVEGEISNLSRPASGHLYFSLKDKAAQVRCAMFRVQRQRLKFPVENGALVVVNAQVGLYEPRGDYQLIVDHMEPAGDGVLRLAFEKLKQQLLAQGLFEQDRKRDIPVLPGRIGIITSPTGAAIHDILTVLKRRFQAIPVIIYPSLVQGDNAAADIVQALQQANQRQEVDVLILARGGGSLEDLWAFNEERVARAIVDSEIPIITGIGHETDVTIADFSADLRAPTPSAAAESAVPEQAKWLSQFQWLQDQLAQTIQQKIKQHEYQLNWLSRALQPLHPGQQLQRNAQRLDELENRLHRSWSQLVRHQHNRLEIKQNKLNRLNPMQRIGQQRQQLNFLQSRLQRDMHQKLDQLKRQQLAMSQTLHAVSPLATLDRGYAIVLDAAGRNIIKSTQQLSVNDFTETRLRSGVLISQVKELKHDENDSD